MARNLLPAGLVPPSRTAEYEALIGKSLEQEKPLIDKKMSLLKEGVQEHTGLITQRFIKDLRAVDTGNPIEDDRIRHEMNKNRPTNLYDDKVLNPLMQTLKTEGATDYTSDLDLTTKMRGEEHRLWDKNAMSLLDPSAPDYIKNLGDAVEHSTRYGINAPAVTAAATQAFTNTPIEILDKTFTDAITAAGGDINNPKSFNTRTYNEVIRVAANNMAKNNRHIQDKAIFIARAKELVGKHLKYGKQFSLRMKAEGSETYGSVKMDELTGNLNTSISRDISGPAVVMDVNAALKHMKTFDITPEQKQRIMPSIMQALATTDLIKGSGRRAGFGEARLVLESFYPKGKGKEIVTQLLKSGIPVGIQSKLEQGLRRIYQDKFKNNIPNDILNLQIDTIFNDDSALSTAMGIGKDDAATRQRVRAETAKSVSENRISQVRKLNEIKDSVDGGLVNVINKEISKRYRDEGKFHAETGEEEEKLQYELREGVRNLRGMFWDPETNENLLSNEAEDAFMLAARRMFVNNVKMDQQGKILRFFGALPDFSLTRRGGDLSGDDQLTVLELLYENLPRTGRSTKRVETGTDQLRKLIVAKRTEAKTLSTKEASDIFLNSGKSQVYSDNQYLDLRNLGKLIPEPVKQYFRSGITR